VFSASAGGGTGGTSHDGNPMNPSLLNCLAIGTAGFIGALSRYGIVLLSGRWVRAGGFPWATLVINVTGSAFLGWFYAFMEKRMTGPHAVTLRLAIATGFVGAYTTFSTYMFETDGLISKGSYIQATGYLFGSLVFGLLGVRTGIIIARM
jgi:CrcB protein